MACSSAKFPADDAWRGMVDRIKKELQCTICLNTLTDLRILPCLHSFCLQCLKDLLPWRDAAIFRCPICNTMVVLTGSVANLCVNFKLNSLLEYVNGMEATVRCSVNAKPIVRGIERMVSDEIKCPLCDGVLAEPRHLHCGHTFCTRCIEFMKPTREFSSNEVICCPSCSHKTDVSDGVEKLPLDLEKLVNIYRQASSNPQVMSAMVELELSYNMHEPKPEKKHPTAPPLKNLVISQPTPGKISPDLRCSQQLPSELGGYHWQSSDQCGSQWMSQDTSGTQSIVADSVQQPPVIFQPRPNGSNSDQRYVDIPCWVWCIGGIACSIPAIVCCPCLIYACLHALCNDEG